MTLNRRMLWSWLCLVLLCGAAASRAAPADVVVEGQRFAAQQRVAGQELHLNGTGVRAVAWFKGYAAGLYVPQKLQSPEALMAQSGAKRLQLRMLQDVPPAEFVKALRRGMERNTAQAQQAGLHDRVERFAMLIHGVGKVKKGDVVDLDLDPDRGLLFSLNGTLRGDAIPGVDFYTALLRAFIGDKPYDERMKAGLLGRPN
jgi:Chalcone isomerase-like